MYPSLGATLNQSAQVEKDSKHLDRKFSFDESIELTGAHLEAFHWLMHLADGTFSNFAIAEKSGLDLDIINAAISEFHRKGLVKL